MAGSDYTSISSDEVFTSGSLDGANRCVDITILDAAASEELEELNFTLTLTTPDLDVMLGNDVTIIVITGNDNEDEGFYYVSVDLGKQTE